MTSSQKTFLLTAIWPRNDLVFRNTQSWQCWHYCQLCIFKYLQFAALLQHYNDSKCEVIYQWVWENCIVELYCLLAQLISNGTANQSWRCWHSCVDAYLEKTNRVGDFCCNYILFVHLCWRVSLCMTTNTKQNKAYSSLHEQEYWSRGTVQYPHLLLHRRSGR